nr:hypothetical protein [Tanacetum cinerariifolium]
MMQEQESTKSDEEESADYEHEKAELRMWLTVVSDEEETTPVNLPVALEVEAARVASPAGALDLITYVFTESDLSKDLPAPVTSLFLHSSDSFDTSKDSATNGSLERPPLQDPYAVVPTSPRVPRRPTILVLRGQKIPLGLPYRTQPNGVRKMLTTRKRVQALPLGLFALRYPPDHSSSDNFSLDSSSDYSLDSSSGHSLPDSSFSFDDSSFDTPATISVGLSHKRRRIKDSVTESDYDDSIKGSYKAYTEPEIDFDVQVDIDADTTAAETATALKVSIGTEADVRVEVGIGIEREDEVEEKAEIMPTTIRSGMTLAAIDEMIEQRVAEALEAYKANKNRRPTMESRDEHKDDNRDDIGNNNCNGDSLRGGNRNVNRNVNVGGLMPVTLECNY